MKLGRSQGLLALVIAGVMGLAGCASSGGAATGAGESTQTAPAPASPAVSENNASAESQAMSEFDPLKTDVTFGFDKALLNSEDRMILKKDASILKAHSGVKVVIAGHADERGTDAYNIVLGQKRAKAAKIYLVRLGVSAKRIKIVSYGKREIPDYSICSDHNEACWAKNRVAHFMKITM
ncbi:MAG: OmpA family protein [Nitrospirota bacterium]|nr:OmpA family protein [Nitrospirota bacterium]